MPSALTTIEFGVLSGVITSIIIFSIVKIFQSVIIPWYRELIYQGVEVCGSWYGRLDNSSQLITLDLNHSASLIKGTATFSSDNPKGGHFEPIRVFILNGSIQDRFVTLTGAHRDRQRLGVNVFLLEVKGDGRKLEGMTTFYSVTSSKITSGLILFTRENPKKLEHSPAVAPTSPATKKGNP